MCGIAGILGTSSTITAESLQLLTVALRHRGPDDCGSYLNPERNVGLAQTRLSILDLSAAGHQPMISADGRYVIVFNGEVYNFRELRPALERRGVEFKSDSDTEVLLYLYAEHGPRMLPMLAGMFAFAIWDTREHTAFLARDPLGIKPLYYGIDGDRLIFASEMRAVLKAWSSPKKLDHSSLGQYLLFGSVPDPGTLVQGIQSLPAGHSLTWKSGSTSLHSYWTPAYAPTPMSVGEATSLTRNALEESMDRHLVSDVPVGVFLSGGIDSTALTALASAKVAQPLNTFCISFEENEFNEGALAQRTAEHFHTQHHDWRLKADEGLSLIDSFLQSLDRPTNDGFNTYCVSMLARKHGLKVVLSGLGGDELFGSYPSFRLLPKLLRWHAWGGLAGPLRGIVGNYLQSQSTRSNLRRLGVFLNSRSNGLAAYWAIRGFFTPSEARKLIEHYTGTNAGNHQVDTAELLNVAVPEQPTPQDLVAYLESTRYMQFQLLRDSDVFSMAHGLELRVPFVDSRLFETVNRVPASIRLAAGKQLLCDAVPEIPAWIANAPKKGFRFPFEHWVKNHWSERFAQLERTIPVKLDSWYRKWTLLMLEHFMHSNEIN